MEDALRHLGVHIWLGYRYNRSTWFSGRLRYDFALGDWSKPYLIEVHGEQHCDPYRHNNSDITKRRLALHHGCPFLAVPYDMAYAVSENLLTVIAEFLRPR